MKMLGADTLAQHMRELASHCGASMPRSQREMIPGPTHSLRAPRREHGPFVLRETVAALIAPAIELHGIGRLAWWSGMSERTLFRIVHGNAKVVSVKLADDLICGGLGDPSLWATTPGLEYVNMWGRPL